MPAILFVCTANRFRSPIAAFSFAQEAEQRKNDHRIRVASAGTWTYNGHPATNEAQNEAIKYGLNLSLHKSRLITESILNDVDLVLVMDANHKEAITQEFPHTASKVFLLTEVALGTPYDIPDPYNTTEPPDEVAEEIVSMIAQGYEKIFELALKLEKQHQSENRLD